MLPDNLYICGIFLKKDENGDLRFDSPKLSITIQSNLLCAVVVCKFGNINKSAGTIEECIDFIEINIK